MFAIPSLICLERSYCCMKKLIRKTSAMYKQCRDCPLQFQNPLRPLLIFRMISASNIGPKAKGLQSLRNRFLVASGFQCNNAQLVFLKSFTAIIFPHFDVFALTTQERKHMTFHARCGHVACAQAWNSGTQYKLQETLWSLLIFPTTAHLIHCKRKIMQLLMFLIVSAL